MLLALLIVTECLLSSGIQATECAIGLVDDVAAVVDGYRNVLDGVKKTTNFQLKPTKEMISNNSKESKRPSFNNAVGDLLQHDLCDLEKLVRYILEECKTCPGCNETNDDCDFVKRDVVFLLDSSDSVTDVELSLEIQFVVDLINRLDKGDDVIRVAALFFVRDEAQIVFKLDDFVGNLAGAAQELSVFSPGGGQSDIAEALNVVRTDILNNEGDRENVDDTLIILTDGISFPPSEYNMPTAVPDLEVIPIGVGLRDPPELMKFSRPEDNFFSVEEFTDLEAIAGSFLEKFCRPCEPECKNGATCDALPNQCICAPGFFGSRCQSMSVCKQDDPPDN